MMNRILFLIMDPKTSKQSCKRSRSDSGSCPEFTPNWPRHLVIESTDVNMSLKKLSPFAVNKGIEGIIGTPKNIKRLRSGDILVEVDRRGQADNLVHTKKIVDIPVRVTPHRSLNSKKGVIRCPDIKHCTDNEILEELASQHVTSIYRIEVTREGIKQPTGTFIVTFNSPTLPSSLKVGYLQVKVDLYIPNPMRCFKCQRYGHYKTSCSRSEACMKCGKDDHSDEHCQGAAHCVNCEGNHPANAKTCPKWIEEKQIQRIKVTGNMTYSKAREMYQLQDARVKSYAGAVTTNKTSVATQTKRISATTQTDFTWPEDSPSPIPTWVGVLKPTSNTASKSIQAKASTSSKNQSKQSESVATRPNQKTDQIKHRSRSRDSMRRQTQNSSTNQSTVPNTSDKRKDKSVIQSNRVRKGSDDPIQVYNKYEALGDSDTMEFSVPETQPLPEKGVNLGSSQPPPKHVDTSVKAKSKKK